MKGVRCKRVLTVPSRYHETGIPTWCASATRHADRPGVDTAAHKEPGDDRIRVPHLPGVELVASPDGCGHPRHEMEQSPRRILVLRQPLGALDSFANVWDDPITPAPDLVAEDAQAARPAAPDRTSGDGPSLLPIGVWHGTTLDREAALRHVDLERRVVEIEAPPAFQQRHGSLENLAIEPHGVTTGAQGKPVEVDCDERWGGLHLTSIRLRKVMHFRRNRPESIDGDVELQDILPSAEFRVERDGRCVD